MGRFLRGLALCLGWGLVGAIIAFGLGAIWANSGSGGFEGSSAMGRAILLIFYLTPGGFVLGVLAGAIRLWRGR
jgi:hypothetical protein